MTWFFAIVVVLAMGGIALVASGRGGPMLDEYDDRPDALVPDGTDLTAPDLRRVRFSIAFRGYRMSEVDALLSRLASELEADRAWQPADPAAEAEADAALHAAPDVVPEVAPDVAPDEAPDLAEPGPVVLDKPGDVPPESPGGLTPRG